MAVTFTPSPLTFRALVGNSVSKSCVLSSAAFLYTGLTSTPGRPFTTTDANSVFLHNKVTFQNGVNYYVHPDGSISATPSCCIIGVGNSDGGLDIGMVSLEILSLNNGDPLTLVGSYTDGVDYFFSTDGSVVPSSSPFRSGIYVGTGNADKNIDVDVKALAIDVNVFTAPVLLDIDFTVSGTATLVSDKVYIEAYNGSVWIDLNAGNPVNVVLGEFELTTAQLKASDGFESGNVYVVRARDFDGYATSSTENIETYDLIFGTTEEGGAIVQDELGNVYTYSD